MSILLVAGLGVVLAVGPVDAGAKQRAGLVEGHERALDASMLVGPEAVPGRLVVDVREKPEGKIPGAVAMPLHVLKTKGFLRGRKVLLVNEGYGYERVVQECSRLRRTGVPEAAVLAGGMAQWVKSGKGTRVVCIPPLGFYADKDLSNVLVVAVHGAGGSRQFDLLPGALVLPERSGVELVVGAAKEAASERKALYVLVVAEDAGIERAVAKALDDAITVPVFRLQGGYKGYRAFLDQQVKIWQGGGRVSVSGCATCN